jgi:outer membrane murein-binding lipoprotein Lpp
MIVITILINAGSVLYQQAQTVQQFHDVVAKVADMDVSGGTFARKLSWEVDTTTSELSDMKASIKALQDEGARTNSNIYDIKVSQALTNQKLDTLITSLQKANGK